MQNLKNNPNPDEYNYGENPKEIQQEDNEYFHPFGNCNN